MANVIFAEMGFGDIYSLPMANAENQALEKELQMKRKEKSNLQNKISQHRETVQALSDFLKNVKQELLHTQALSKAVEKEVESEVHFRILADREVGCLQQETTQLDKELCLLRQKKNTLESEILKGSQKLEKMKTQINWDQQTLDDRLEEFAREDEDTMVLAKYCRQDEARIKELTLSIDKTTAEINQKHKALDKEWTNTMAAQVALDRTTENFQSAHRERQELIHQWENAIEQMRKRDCGIEQCIMSLSQANQEVRERQDMLAEKKMQLENQKSNNQEYEKKVVATKKLASQLRVEFQDNESLCGELKSEFEGLRCTVEQVATKVETMRSQLTSLNNDKKDKSFKLKNAKLLIAVLGQKMKDVTESAIGVEGVASMMERMVEEEDLANMELESMTHHQRRVLSQKAKDLQALKAKEENLMAEIFRTRDVLRNLLRHLRNVEDDYVRNQELIESQDCQIKVVKEKQRRLKGGQNSQKDHAFRLELAELTKNFEEKKRTTIMLSQQLRSLEVETRCVKKTVEKVETQKADLSSKLVEMELCNEVAEREFKKLILKTQESLLEDNILTLDTKRVRDRLQIETERVLFLEKQRMTLEAAMREKDLEVDFNRDMLQTQVRINSQKNQRLRMEMNENLSKIDKMKVKYETIAVPIMPPDGEGGHSLEYYMVQAAQEKEELKRKGDKLDKKVSKKETEVEALENTLHAISHRTEHRKVSGLLSQSTEEYGKHLELEDQKRALEGKCRFKMRQIRELQQDIAGVNNSLDDLHQEEVTLKEQRNENCTKILTLNKELESQKERLDRVAKQCSRLTGDIRSSQKTKSKTREEYEIDLCQLKDFEKIVERMLLEAMDEDPDLRSVLQTHFQENNLPLPESVFPIAIHLTPGSRSSGSSIRADSPPPRLSKPGSRVSSASSATSPVRVRSAGSVRFRAESPALHVPKPGSRLSSARSSLSSLSGCPRTSGPRSPHVKKVDLGLQLMVSSAFSATTPRGSRPGGSGTSRSTPKKKSQRKST
ncbi:coiled-coil domain-containing protein 39-like isoform X2 [Conger conger]|uniref:coiled-coil domain-containing protein 39-like isoform X2 n=1 Tax=Conger conger TaxID=82655 RepID=UPI002A5A57F0|nr:coiled-coil domain-containing protein 39-like isoform X2 [Conger conger]